MEPLGEFLERNSGWRDSEALLALLESAWQGILGINVEGRIVMVNSMVERLFGYRRQELLGQPLELLVPEEKRAGHVIDRGAYFRRPHERPMGHGFDLRGVRKDGTTLPVEISLNYVDTATGRIAFAFITDITEQKRSEADLKHFASIISHDLQEPLRTIKAFATLLSREYGPSLDPRGQEMIEFILRGGAQMGKLISGLLEYSRVINSRQAAVPVRVDVNTVVDAAMENLRAAVEEAQGMIDREDLPTVLGYPLLLVQLFQNLLGNSLRYRREGVAPRIAITARRDRGRYVICVRDNGIGIPPEHLDRVFEIHYRAHGEHYPGSGIGLAISKQIVERHQGRIWAEASAGGTSILFTLRAANEA